MYQIALLNGLIKLHSNVDTIYGSNIFANVRLMNIINQSQSYTLVKEDPFLEIRYYLVNDKSLLSLYEYYSNRSKKEIALHPYSLVYSTKDIAVVFCERKIAGPIKMRCILSVRKLSNNKSVLGCFFNAFYYDFIRFRLGGLVPPGEILTMLSYVALLSNNLLLVHSSCVKVNGQIFLFVAPPNTGKSTLAFRLSRKYGGTLISEDVTPCFVSSRTLTFFPNMHTSTFLNSPVIVNGLSAVNRIMCKIDNEIRDIPVIPFFLKFVNHTSVAYKLLVESNLERAPVSSDKVTIVFLESNTREEPYSEQLDTEAASKRLLFLNRSEFRYWSEDIFPLLSEWDGSFELKNIVNDESRLTTDLVEHSRAYILGGRSINDFESLFIKDLLA